METIGTAEGLHSLLLQSLPDGTITVYPGWPEYGSPASFARLRATGAFLVSARWNGSSVFSPVTILSLAGRRLSFANPFGAGSHAVCLLDGAGNQLAKASGTDAVVQLADTIAQMEYRVVKC